MADLKVLKERHGQQQVGFWNACQTGYFAAPNSAMRKGRASKVHIAYRGEPVCSSRFGDDMAFQFCAQGVRLPHVECRICLHHFAQDAPHGERESEE